MRNLNIPAKPAYLIDASIYIFQAHFSPYVECLDEAGEDVSALFGYAQFLLQFLRRENPDYIAVALDESLFCGFRHSLCPRYKSNRELPDENLARQLAACNELSQVLGLPTFASRKYEADDIIGTLASRLRQHKFAAQDSQPDGLAILTRDKDLCQLLKNPREYVWDYQGNRKRYITHIVDEMGISPGQLPDYLGLVGDAVDRIGGVPGVGPVKGKELLQKFDSLDGVYNNLDKVPLLPLRGAKRLAELLEQYRSEAYLSRQLATIVQDVKEDGEEFSIRPVASLRRQQVDVDKFREFISRQKLDKRTGARFVNLAQQLNQSELEG